MFLESAQHIQFLSRIPVHPVTTLATFPHTSLVYKSLPFKFVRSPSYLPLHHSLSLRRIISLPLSSLFPIFILTIPFSSPSLLIIFSLSIHSFPPSLTQFIYPFAFPSIGNPSLTLLYFPSPRATNTAGPPFQPSVPASRPPQDKSDAPEILIE